MNELVEITPKFHVGEGVLIGDECLPPDLWGNPAVIRGINVIICDGRKTVLYELEMGQSRAYRTALEDVLRSTEDSAVDCRPIVLRHRYDLRQQVDITDAPGAPHLVGRRGTIEQIFMVAGGEERKASYYVNTGSARRYIQEVDLTAA